MPELRRPDITLHYEIEGNGPPLVLIAGMMSDSASWAPLVPLLGSHFTLIRPDNRTTGRTIPADASVSIDHIAADCDALIRHLDIGPAHILGHSMGGLVGLQMLESYTQSMQSLTLAAAAPLRLRRNLALFKTLLAIRQSDAPAETWLLALFPWLFAPEVFENTGTISDAVKASLAYPHAQTIKAMAHQITAFEHYQPAPVPCPAPIPVQAILGENDLLLPPELALPTLMSVPHHLVPKAGHSIHWDAPQQVASHLISLLSSPSVQEHV